MFPAFGNMSLYESQEFSFLNLHLRIHQSINTIFYLQTLRRIQGFQIFKKIQVQQSYNSDIGTSGTSDERLQGHFCSDTVFNLSNRVLSENEIKGLEKCLDFAPIQRRINKLELYKDFEEFCRRMRTNWHIRNELSQDFSVVPFFAQNLLGNHHQDTLC